MDQTPQAQEYLRCCARNLDRLRRENGDRAQPPSVQHGIVYASEVASILKRTDEEMLEYRRTYRLPESFADGTPCSPFMGYKKYLNRKLYWAKPHRNLHGDTDRPVHWGNRFEPIAARIFHSMEGKTVEMFPKKIHRRYRWLGAIADGVVYDFPSRPEVELLEMKCPFRAGISEIPPPYYWTQALILMEVFDIGVTNFFQCQFRIYRNEEEFLADEIKVGQDKGVCIQFGLDDVTPSPEDATLAEAIEWAKDVIDAQYPDERLKEVYWKLVDASIIRIKRDSQWFEKIKHILYRAHLDIQGYPADYIYDPELPAMPIFQSTEPELLTKYIETSEDICGESNDEGVV